MVLVVDYGKLNVNSTYNSLTLFSINKWALSCGKRYKTVKEVVFQLKMNRILMKSEMKRCYYHKDEH